MGIEVGYAEMGTISLYYLTYKSLLLCYLIFWQYQHKIWGYCDINLKVFNIFYSQSQSLLLFVSNLHIDDC